MFLDVHLTSLSLIIFFITFHDFSDHVDVFQIVVVSFSFSLLREILVFILFIFFMLSEVGFFFVLCISGL